MIERLFVGWHRPVLAATVEMLEERYARGSAWNLRGALVVVPGGQAGRRLRRLLESAAQARGRRLAPPEVLTPAALPERLYRAPRPPATPAQTHFAWVQALQTLSPADLRLLAPAGEGTTSGWSALAEEIARLREALMAEGLTLWDASRRCAALAGFCEDRRWDALPRLERAYAAALAAAGLADRDDARLDALRDGALSCRHDVVLVGAVDLNGTERALLRGLRTRVTAIIPAPPDEADGFDDVGGLRTDHWHDKDIPVPDDVLHFVEDPAAEAAGLSARVSALGRRYAREDITLGVGDERGAEALARRLAVYGLPIHSPFGRPLSRTRPAALLSGIADWLRDPSARRFAALVRHPDLEDWLGQGVAEIKAGLLDALDVHVSDRLPERLCPDALPPAVAAAWGQVDTLLAPLRGPQRPLTDWAEPIARLLRTVYAGRALEESSPEDRQLTRAFEGVRDALQAVKTVGPALAPQASGVEALSVVLGRLEGQRLPADEAEDGMEMMGWLELALDDAPALLLTGLNEGSVPAGGQADPLLPDTLRRHLGLADSRRRQARDSLLLRILLESRAHVQILVPRRGADGSPRMPSRLLFACDALTAARRARRFTEPAGTAPWPLFAPGEARRLPPARPIAPDPAMDRLRVTAFRDYLACPYRFYLRHVLGLEEHRDDADEMDARAFGILLHECLAAFARSPQRDSTDADTLRAVLRDALARLTVQRFGPEPSPALRLQVRQAGRRLDAFAAWQAQEAARGWRIQPRFSEREWETGWAVDGRPFVVHGRLDRVDRHESDGRFRVIDYKTGDAPRGPDRKHRGGVSEDGAAAWTDLQLPLYRRLVAAQGVPDSEIETGYVLLSADLTPVSDKGHGGLSYVAAPWTEADYDSADRCAEDVIRGVRAGVFWPPAAPPRFPDPYSPLCLDSCRDRAEWFTLVGGAA